MLERRRGSQNLGNYKIFLNKMAWIKNFVTVAITTSDPNYEIPPLFQFYYKFHVKVWKSYSVLQL